MKTKITFLTAVLFLGIKASYYAQWTEIPQGTGMWGVDKIDCIDENNCFIGGGNDGLVMKTSDGGANWTDVGIIETNGTNYLKMFDLDTTYLIRGTTLYRTYNAGTAWESVEITQTNFFYFLNPQIAYGLNATQGVYKSIDRGNSWTQVGSLPIGATFINNPYFLNEEVGFVTGATSNSKCIYKTENGGQNWTKVFEKMSSTSTFKDIQMVTQQIGFACGLDGLIVKTSDGGNTWVELTSSVQGLNIGLIALDFINTNSGYIVGSQATILKTINGGNTWIDESYTSGFLDDIKVADLNTVFVTHGTSTLLKNSNAGLVLSIFENNAKVGNVFPNPATDKLNVEINKENCRIRFFDATGKELFNGELSKTSINTIDLSGINTGFYIYEIYDNSGILTSGKLSKI